MPLPSHAASRPPLPLPPAADDVAGADGPAGVTAQEHLQKLKHWVRGYREFVRSGGPDH